MKRVDAQIKANYYYYELLNTLIRSGEEVYLYKSNLKAKPISFNATQCSSIGDVDMRCSTVTLVTRLNDESERQAFFKLGYITHWIECPTFFNMTGNSNMSDYPMSVEFQVSLERISKIPFDGLPSGRLLYGKDDD